MKKTIDTILSVRSGRYILPAILAIATQKPRYLPEIKWSDKSWTHNIFRVYEVLFWRRHGLRTESSVTNDNGKITRRFYTFESVIAYAETLIRELLSQPKEALALMRSMNNFQLQRGSIAFDTEADSTLATFSKTCTGSNLILIVTPFRVGDAVVSVTYNLVAATFVVKGVNVSTETAYLYYLVNPATGSNSVVVSAAPNKTFAVSYSGAAQTGQMDASTHAEPTATTATLALTSVLANCWAVSMVRSDTANVAVTSGPINTQRGAAGTITYWDTNTSVSAGSQSTVYNDGGSSCGWSSVAGSIAPFVVATVANKGLLLMGAGN